MVNSRRPDQKSYRTLRLTFEYAGRAVRLVSRQSVEMVTPAPNPTPISEGQTGFWYELRDHAGRILYQRALHNPIRFDVEVFSNDPKEPIHRRPVDNPRGTFELLVPDTLEGDTVVIFSSPHDPERAAEPAVELSRVSLRQEPKDEVV
ncbi:MAG: hypothetical protein M3176_09315 [Chloroflexota bacterium]|nr:hypothetical protein [Chloroflexota bacterium]